MMPHGIAPYIALAILIVGAVCAWLLWIRAYAQLGRWWAARKQYGAANHMRDHVVVARPLHVVKMPGSDWLDADPPTWDWPVLAPDPPSIFDWRKEKE